jgi:hypothetical protein
MGKIKYQWSILSIGNYVKITNNTTDSIYYIPHNTITLFKIDDNTIELNLLAENVVLRINYIDVVSPISTNSDNLLSNLSSIIYTTTNFTGIAGSGTLNYLSKFTPSGVIIGNSQIYDNGTNVGIGTNTPIKKLSVNGSVRFEQVTNVTFDVESATVNTTDATSTLLQAIAIPLNTTITIDARIQCKKTGGTGSNIIGDSNSYIRVLKVKNISGVLSYNFISSTFTDEDILSCSINIIISGADINIQVTGVINNNMTWTSSSIITK